MSRDQLDEAGLERAWRVYNRDGLTARDAVASAIKAYLTEPPKWPTDGSVSALEGDWPTPEHREDWRADLRRAMLADPIIKAAVRLRDSIPAAIGPIGPYHAQVVQAVIDAVDEAGL